MAKSILHVATESFKNPIIAKKFKTLEATQADVRGNRCKEDAVKSQGNKDATPYGTTVPGFLTFHGAVVDAVVAPVTETKDEKPASKGIAKKS